MALRGCSRLGTVLARLLVLASLGVLSTAIALGRLDPPTSGHRGLRPDRPVWINGQLIGNDSRSRFFDAESGLAVRMTLPEEGEIEQASGSPWKADGGTWQVVGIWKPMPTGATGGFGKMSLVRLGQPDGRVLDSVDPEVYPGGPPCWLPGTSARVLFTGTDGRLFAWAFEGPSDREAAGRQHPRPLVWLKDLPRDEGVFLRDLCVLTDPDLGGRVLVTLRPARGTAGRKLEPSRLWWLELDGGASAIVRAGPLRPEDGEHPDRSERLPRVARTADGRLILAYLLEEPGRATWQLRVAPIAIDKETGDPTVETVAERSLAEGCLPTAPVFSADARWVTGVLRADPAPRPLRRFAVGMEDSGPHRLRPTGSAKAPPRDGAPGPAGRVPATGWARGGIESAGGWCAATGGAGP